MLKKKASYKQVTKSGEDIERVPIRLHTVALILRTTRTSLCCRTLLLVGKSDRFVYQAVDRAAAHSSATIPPIQ